MDIQISIPNVDKITPILNQIDNPLHVDKFETKFTLVELGHDSIGVQAWARGCLRKPRSGKDDIRKVELVQEAKADEEAELG